MPIYEYVCSHCGHRFEKLVRSFGGEQQVHCPRCREDGSERVVSTFAVGSQGTRADLRSAPAPVGGG
jgi:putative FmdB family regulatory protein